MIAQLRIPEHARSHFSLNQHIAFGDKLYTIQDQKIVDVPVAQKLSFKPGHIFQHVAVVVGDTVNTGDILAQAKRILGVKRITSPNSGTITRINHETGVISIATSSESDREQKTFFNGTITDIDTRTHLVSVDLGIGLEAHAGNVSDDAGGAITAIDPPTFPEPDAIDSHIIMVEQLDSHLRSKVDALGAAGIVYVEGETPSTLTSAQIQIEDFKSILQKGYNYILLSSHDKKIFAYN